MPGHPSRRSRADAARGCCTAYMTRALTGSTSAAKWWTKSSSGSQAKPCLSMSRWASAGVGGPPWASSAADRFALVQAEGRDVDQADDVRRVGAQSGHDLPAVGVAGDDGGTVLAVQHLAQPGDIIRQRGLRELGRGDGVAAGLQALDDGAPARAVGPRAVDDDEVRPRIHGDSSFPERRRCQQLRDAYNSSDGARPTSQRPPSRRATTGQSTPVTQPRHSKMRMTVAEISTCRGSAPCLAQAGSEWYMLCQLLAEGEQREGPQVGGAVVAPGSEGAGADHVAQRVDAPGDVLQQGDADQSGPQQGGQCAGQPPIAQPTPNGNPSDTAHRAGNAAETARWQGQPP